MTHQRTRRTATVYLHLKPGYYQQDLVVSKMAKSPDAQVDPGTVVVKAKISVAGDFFALNMPTTEIDFTSADVQPVMAELAADEDPDTEGAPE